MNAGPKKGSTGAFRDGVTLPSSYHWFDAQAGWNHTFITAPHAEDVAVAALRLLV